MIRHIASIAEIVDDMEAAVAYYRDVLGLTINPQGDGADYAVVKVDGVLHFGIWSRAHAALATLGDRARANEIPLGFTVGFEVDSVSEASSEIEAKGQPIAQAPHTEPWGQVTSRFFGPSGALHELSEMPPSRRLINPVKGTTDS